MSTMRSRSGQICHLETLETAAVCTDHALIAQMRHNFQSHATRTNWEPKKLSLELLPVRLSA